MLLSSTTRRLLDRLKIAVKRSATATRQGGHRSPKLASGIEFAEHRAYVAGDDVRNIDWKAFVRNGQLAVRQFEEERDANVVVLLDLSGSMSQGKKLERAKEVAASVIYVALKQFDKPWIFPFGAELEKQLTMIATMADMHKVEGVLENAQAGGPTSLEAAVRAWAKVFHRKSLVVVVTDLMHPKGFEPGLRMLAHLGHDIRVVHVQSEEDWTPNVHGEVELVDIETGETMVLTVDKSLLAAYQKELKDHFETCRLACVRSGGRFITAKTGEPLEKSLRTIFDSENF